MKQSYYPINNPSVEVNIWIKLTFDEVLVLKSNLFKLNGNLNKGFLSYNIEDIISKLIMLNKCTFLTILALGSYDL